MVIELNYKPDILWCELAALNVEYNFYTLLDKSGDVGTQSLFDAEGNLYEYEITKTDISWEKHFEIALWELEQFEVKGLYTVQALGITEVPFYKVIEAIRDDYREKSFSG